MSVLYAAGTTWLLAASEPSRGENTREKCFKNADNCVAYLHETGELLDCGAQLCTILARLVDEHRVKLLSKKQNPRGIRRHSTANTASVSEHNQRREIVLLSRNLDMIPPSEVLDGWGDLQENDNAAMAEPSFGHAEDAFRWSPGFTSSDIAMRAGDLFPNEPSSHMPTQTGFDYLHPTFFGAGESSNVGWPIWPNETPL